MPKVDQRIYVAGHRGLVGSAIVRQLEAAGNDNWIGATRDELNLCEREAVFDFMGQQRPTAVIIAAAKVGGIVANNNFPVEFLSENVQVQTNLMDAAHKFDVEHLVFLGSSCIYPGISEGIWTEMDISHAYKSLRSWRQLRSAI